MQVGAALSCVLDNFVTNCTGIAVAIDDNVDYYNCWSSDGTSEPAVTVSFYPRGKWWWYSTARVSFIFLPVGIGHGDPQSVDHVYLTADRVPTCGFSQLGCRRLGCRRWSLVDVATDNTSRWDDIYFFVRYSRTFHNRRIRIVRYHTYLYPHSLRKSSYLLSFRCQWNAPSIKLCESIRIKCLWRSLFSNYHMSIDDFCVYQMLTYTSAFSLFIRLYTNKATI